jgi:CheY-like chemotaxis protein
VDELVNDLRRLHIDALAESSEWVLRPSPAIGTATCLIIHPSVSPERCDEIRKHLSEQKISLPIITHSIETPIATAVDIARAAQNTATGQTAEAGRKKRPVTIGDKTILIVDDDAILRRALKRTVRRLPASILEAHDPEDANKFLGEVDIDLIMADYSFVGGLNGLDFLAKCRTEHPQIPRMLLSGHDLKTEDSLPGDRSAAHAIMQKPWNLDEFLNTCRKLLDGH